MNVMNLNLIRVFAQKANTTRSTLHFRQTAKYATQIDTRDEEDMPNTNLENPYAKQKKQCILCKYNIEVNYKNPRLLSQFVSPFTGLLYNKHITGLCTKQQQLVERELRLAKYLGLMPYVFRDARFCKDPRLFNPLRPQRPNPY